MLIINMNNKCTDKPASALTDNYFLARCLNDIAPPVSISVILTERFETERGKVTGLVLLQVRASRNTATQLYTQAQKGGTNCISYVS